MLHGISANDDLLHAEGDHLTRILYIADAATVSHRHERLAYDCADEVKLRPSIFRGGCDIQQHQFIYFFFIENLNSVARVTQIDRVTKSNGLDQSRALQ